MECLVRPLREGDAVTISRYEEFFSAENLEIVELTPRVIDLATRLRAAHGIRTPDAIQAACALSLRGRTIFMTGMPRSEKSRALRSWSFDTIKVLEPRPGSLLRHDKVKCGQKHFKARGVPFAVAVTADEVEVGVHQPEVDAHPVDDIIPNGSM